ncbi:MAG: M48 family metalloprotease [Verrucomicrobiales bacterium]|nr:M48 family metalloprotease [Verrucomicrobiales bacterium]
MKNTIIAAVAALIGIAMICLFMRSEMERNRQILRSEMRREIEKAPSSVVREAVKEITDAGSGVNREPDTKPAPEPSTNEATLTPEGLASTLLGVATKTIRTVDQVGLSATRISDAEESRLGGEYDRAIRSKNTMVKNSDGAKRVARVLPPLLKAQKRPAIQITAQVIESSVVNAFSLPGGFVYVTTGFLKEFSDDASLAMVLAHEIGHVDLRHCVERVQYSELGRKMVGDAANLGQAVYQFIRLPYSKDQELAADEFGFRACLSAGHRRSDLLKFYDDFEAYEREKNQGSANEEIDPKTLAGSLNDWLRTHPRTADRRRHLEKLEAE